MFKLFFATPEKKLVSDQELVSITLPAFRGQLNILPGHSPLMTTLEAGILHYSLKSGENKRFAISWGYCQVSAEGVMVLAETAEEGDDLDEKVLREHLKVSEQKLVGEPLDDASWEKTQNEISRIKAELEILKT